MALSKRRIKKQRDLTIPDFKELDKVTKQLQAACQRGIDAARALLPASPDWDVVNRLEDQDLKY